MRTSTSLKDSYRADIDGLRTLAVLSVFLYHLQPDLLPGGFLGVDIFFVISGYLITGIIVRENQLRAFSFVHFYARRIKRIFPALFVVLALSTPVAILLLTPDTYVNYMKSARYASAQLANFLFAREVGYFNEGFQEQPLLHTWSLGVEEQFYLLWPLLVFLCFKLFQKRDAFATHNALQINKKIAATLLLLALLSFLSCLFFAETNHKIAFYMFYTRAWEFCLGGLICLKVLPKSSNTIANHFFGLLGLILLFWGFFFVNNEYLGISFLQFGVIIPCLGAALLIHTNPQLSIANRLLATTLPTSIGKISYSLYLYHWPIIIFWKIFSNSHEVGFVASISIIIVAFTLSILSYLYIEQPARRSNLPDRYVLILAAITIFTCISGYKTAERYDVAPWRITRYDNASHHTVSSLPPQCVEKKKNGLVHYQCNSTGDPAPIIALVGDSHSPHYRKATVTWASRNGYDVLFLGLPGCPMLIGEVKIRSFIEKNHESQCGAALPLFVSQVVENKNVEIVLIAQRFDLFHTGKGFLQTTRQLTFRDPAGGIVKDHTSYYTDKLSLTVNTLQEEGKEVIILKQVPLLASIKACNWEPRLKKMLSQEHSCSYDIGFIKKWQQPSIDFIDRFAAEHNIEMFDPFLYLDKPIQNGISLYTNTDHLNEYGSDFLVPHFLKILDGIMARKSLHSSP